MTPLPRLRLVPLLILLAACRSGAPAYTINVPPRVVEVRPPRSVAFFASELRLDALQAALDRAIPPALSGGGALPLGGAALGARWQLRRQPGVLLATPAGLQLRVRLDGQIQIGAGLLGCQASGPIGAVVLDVRPALNPAGELLLADPQVQILPQADLRCAGVPIPAAPLLQQTLEPLGRGLAALIPALRLPLGPLLRQGLEQLAAPRELPLLGQRACLDLDPQALVLAPLSGDGGALQVRVGADVAPRLSLGPCSPRSRSPLSAVLVRELALAPQFQLLVAVAIPHADLTARLAPIVVGRRLGDPGGPSLVVDRAAVGDASGRALVKLEVHGALDGSLFLWGTPQVAPRPGLAPPGRLFLSVPDLQVAAETESFLQKIKLAAFNLWDGGAIAVRLREQLALDVTDQLEQVRLALSGRYGLRGGAWAQLAGLQGLALTTSLSAVRPVEVESRPGLLVIHALLVGQATLSL